MDTLADDALAQRIAERLGDALAAPTLRPGCSGHHMDFPGTIPAAVLLDLLRSYCRSPDEHGFVHIVLVPTHGGNFAPVNTVTPEIAREIDAGNHRGRRGIPAADTGRVRRPDRGGARRRLR